MAAGGFSGARVTHSSAQKGRLPDVAWEVELGAQKGHLLAVAQKIKSEPKQHSAGALRRFPETGSRGCRGNGQSPQEMHFLGLWRHHPHRAQSA